MRWLLRIFALVLSGCAEVQAPAQNPLPVPPPTGAAAGTQAAAVAPLQQL